MRGFDREILGRAIGEYQGDDDRPKQPGFAHETRQYVLVESRNVNTRVGIAISSANIISLSHASPIIHCTAAGGEVGSTRFTIVTRPLRAVSLLRGLGRALKELDGPDPRTTCPRPPHPRLLEDGRTLVAGAVNDAKRIASLKAAGAEVAIIPNDSGKVELYKLMEELARRELNEIHVEAGTRLNGSLLQAGVVDELLVYLAPRIIGDSGRGMFSLPELTELSQATALEIREVERVGEDLRILARL